MTISLYQLITWIASIIAAALIGALINRWMQLKPKVICYISQSASFMIKSNVEIPFDVATHSLVLKNQWKCVAKEVQVIHGLLPDYFEVSPGIEWNTQVIEGGAKAITFPTLLPGEQATISYMYPPSIQFEIHTGVRHQDGLVNVIKVLPVKVYHAAINWLVLLFMIIGIVTVIAAILYLTTPADFHLSFTYS